MQILEPPPKDHQGLTDRVSSALGDDSEHANLKAQELIKSVLAKYLDDRYRLLCNYSLPRPRVQIPLTLVGPAGISVITTSEVRGTYRVTGEDMVMMNAQNRKFEPVEGNPVRLTHRLAQTVHKYLAEHKMDVPAVEGAMVFTNPAAYVETSDPAVRVIIPNAMEVFAEDLNRSAEQFNEEQIETIVRLLTREAKSGSARVTLASSSIRDNFTTGQWLILGALLLFVAGLIAVLLNYLLF